MLGLDAYIMGLNDPRAPFNESDKLQCEKCSYESSEDNFEWEEEDLLARCPNCGEVVWISDKEVTNG